MSLESEIADFLETDVLLDGIDFFIGPGNRVHVTGAGLHQVGKLIRDERIRVKPDDARIDSTKPKGASALYDARLDTIFVRSEMRLTNCPWAEFRGSWSDKMIIVHEAVHALLDADGRAVLSLRNEAAGYLAGVVFAKLHGTAEHIDTAKAIYAAACSVAFDNELHLKPPKRLWGRQIKPLTAAIRDVYGHGWLDREDDHDGIKPAL